MKAILFDAPGGPDVLRYGDAPDPQPVAGELLVRVRAAAVNRADILQRRGHYAPPPGASPILGLELAGEVVQPTGLWHAGDRVMAVVTGGGYAELATVPAGMAMRIPDRFSFEQAAAIPEAFLTAYLNLFTLGNLQANETVLIHAGASGVGSAAIQLARAAGAQVIATAGAPEKVAFCRDLGASLAVNYKQEDFAEHVLAFTSGHGADVVLDFVGAPYWNANLRAIATHGRLMLIGMLGGSRGELDLGLIMAKRITVTGTTLRRTPLPEKIALTQAFAAFAMPRFERGELRPIIDSIYPLRDAAEAHRRVEANHNIGKIVLVMDS
ncbi:MAG: NAD(P)H-quinone oxidoreductase [Chloroflexi bacterium]|jgi:putative PIG3 family NAD(P)H quinone oxidoreductase|uniref:NADPH:quinone oxidoreductase n=1 Tax=Candidatus Thermofonsia Clade 3 bacterium TaxID=2364212 RepID=A0A2M8QD52_9CHLR|nr:NAD(P)H-quinone oxidoreductase [Candidatus Roseilinea sp. NK_OTU-006]PJF47724.1 MAG: NADPH:quinone oxidoreductase [Candidatus Thermofonsia Clade 3 bacterium]RMG64937.1 MAG: NAD(P)H-quinone oxidoreductase [Chloroflexota bacterium]